MIMTSSGQLVKRPVKTSQIVRALRRAKAPAGVPAKAPLPSVVERWASSTYKLTDLGRAATGSVPMTEELLALAVSAVQKAYTVQEEGDHLRFVGAGTGNVVRISKPCAGADGTVEETFVMRGSQVPWPEEAFERAAALWAEKQAGAAGKGPARKEG